MAIFTKKLILLVLFCLLPLLSARVGELDAKAELDNAVLKNVKAKQTSPRDLMAQASQEHRTLGLLKKLKVKYVAKKIKKKLFFTSWSLSKSSKSKKLFSKSKSKGKGGKGGKGHRDLQSSTRNNDKRNRSPAQSRRSNRRGRNYVRR